MPPTVDISFNKPGPYKGSQTDVTIKAIFNEAIKSDPLPQITITGTDIPDVTITNMVYVDASTCTFLYTIPTTQNGSGTISITTAQDLAGNEISATPTNNTFLVQNDITPPVITSTSISTNNLNITVNFDEDVYSSNSATGDLEAADFQFTLTGGTAKLQSQTPSAIKKNSQTQYDLSVNYTPDSVANSLEVIKITPATATSIFDFFGNASDTSQDDENNKVSLFDTTAPVINSISTTTVDGSYNDTAVIPIKITFSEPVRVVGVPTLTLNLNGIGYSTNYTSGDNSTELIFDYTVLNGHNAANLAYENTTSLSLESGVTIKDIAGNDATLSLIHI